MIVISMETAQQQAGSWQPIRACSGSVSHPMGEAGEGDAECVCGPVKVNGKGGVIRSTYFLVGLRNFNATVWKRDTFLNENCTSK